MNLIYNERVKLLASAVSNTAVATAVTAIIAPVAGLLYGASTAPASEWWPLIGGAWFLLSVIIHVSAQFILGRLRE